MNNREQIDAFAGDIKRVIARYAAEFEMTLAEVIGTLEIVKMELFNEQSQP